MNNVHLELLGDAKNPYHFSVGCVIRRGNKIAIIQKTDKHYTLLRETAYSDESPIATLQRGAREELGVEIVVKRFLGGLVTHFKREGNNMDIEKTTIYFEAEAGVDISEKRQELDELQDVVLWVPYEEAYRLFQEQNNPEIEMLLRAR